MPTTRHNLLPPRYLPTTAHSLAAAGTRRSGWTRSPCAAPPAATTSPSTGEHQLPLPHRGPLAELQPPASAVTSPSALNTHLSHSAPAAPSTCPASSRSASRCRPPMTWTSTRRTSPTSPWRAPTASWRASTSPSAEGEWEKLTRVAAVPQVSRSDGARTTAGPATHLNATHAHSHPTTATLLQHGHDP